MSRGPVPDLVFTIRPIRVQEHHRRNIEADNNNYHIQPLPSIKESSVAIRPTYHIKPDQILTSQQNAIHYLGPDGSHFGPGQPNSTHMRYLQPSIGPK